MYQAVRRFIRKLTPDAVRPYRYLEFVARRRSKQIVASGPFKGMRYGGRSIGSAYIPKIVGSYERELAPAIETIVAARPSRVIDVGAAEGYYAVGLALRLPESEIIAFEAEAVGREALAEMAALNGVGDQVKIRGKCEPVDLASALDGRRDAVVIMDVEGYEQVLLDPIAVPELRQATLLVELHEFDVPDIVETVERRFSATHRMSMIWEEDRNRHDFPWKTMLTKIISARRADRYVARALYEIRPERMRWYFAEPIA